MKEYAEHWYKWDDNIQNALKEITCLPKALVLENDLQNLVITKSEEYRNTYSNIANNTKRICKAQICQQIWRMIQWMTDWKFMSISTPTTFKIDSKDTEAVESFCFI